MTAPSLRDELEGVVRLAEKATPGPFVVDDYGDVTANGEDIARIASGGYEAEHDAKLFASAVNFIRAHHAEIADMAKRLEAAERLPAKWRSIADGEIGDAYAGPWNTCADELDAATQEGEG